MTITQPGTAITPFAAFLSYLNLNDRHHVDVAIEATTGYAVSLITELLRNPAGSEQIANAYRGDLAVLPDGFAHTILIEFAWMSQFALLTGRTLGQRPPRPGTGATGWDLTTAHQELYRQWVGLVLTAGAMEMAGTPRLLDRFQGTDLPLIALRVSHDAIKALPDPHRALHAYRHSHNLDETLEQAATQPLLRLGRYDTPAALVLVLDCAGEPLEHLQTDAALDYTDHTVTHLVTTGALDAAAIRDYLNDLHHLASGAIQTITHELGAMFRYALAHHADGPRPRCTGEVPGLIGEGLLEPHHGPGFGQWVDDHTSTTVVPHHRDEDPSRDQLINQARYALVAATAALRSIPDPTQVLEDYLAEVEAV